MAKLKSLRLKSRDYIFKAFGNGGEAVPAKVVFNRFPQLNESFTSVETKNLFNGIDVQDIPKRELQSKIADKIVDSFLSNMRAGSTDLPLFMKECVEKIEDLEYEGRGVSTVQDFWQILPRDAAEVIAGELYGYAVERDEFTMGES
jgi:hypothetical protein